MALSLGPVAFEAGQRLKHTEDWQIIMKALEEQMGKQMHAAVDTAAPDMCGYARGVRDVYCALWTMEAGQDAPQRASQKPPVRSKY